MHELLLKSAEKLFKIDKNFSNRPSNKDVLPLIPSCRYDGKRNLHIRFESGAIVTFLVLSYGNYRHEDTVPVKGYPVLSSCGSPLQSLRPNEFMPLVDFLFEAVIQIYLRLRLPCRT